MGGHRARGAAKPASTSRRRATRPLTVVSTIALVVGVAGAAAWILTRPRPEKPAEVPASPALRMGLEEAHRNALRLAIEGRPNASLPYFRRQIDLVGASEWALHKDYASALHNAAVENGARGPVARSSFERVALVRESLEEASLATGLATTPRDRAMALEDAAHTLWLWGLPWDALVVTERASATGGVSALVAQRQAVRRSIMADPTGPARTFDERGPR